MNMGSCEKRKLPHFSYVCRWLAGLLRQMYIRCILVFKTLYRALLFNLQAAMSRFDLLKTNIFLESMHCAETRKATLTKERTNREWTPSICGVGFRTLYDLDATSHRAAVVMKIPWEIRKNKVNTHDKSNAIGSNERLAYKYQAIFASQVSDSRLL
jgi:hypothetical protein